MAIKKKLKIFFISNTLLKKILNYVLKYYIFLFIFIYYLTLIIIMKRAILVVTSAGLGLRLKEYSFKKYGKYLDKPLVKLKGKTLLEWSIKPFYPLITAGILNFSDIYIVIREDQNEKQFREVIIRINKKINIIKIEKLSRGPAHTAYEACKK